MKNVFEMVLCAIFLVVCAGAKVGGAQLPPSGGTVIEETAHCVRMDAVGLFRLLSEQERSSSFARTLHAGGTNVLVELSRPMPKGWFTDVQTFVVDVFISRDGRRKIVVVGTTKEAKGNLRKECVYDQDGRVVWAVSFDAEIEGGKSGKKPSDVFEFGSTGRVLRVWHREPTPGLWSRRSDGSLREEKGQHAEWDLFGALSVVRQGGTLDEGSEEFRMTEFLSGFFESISMTSGLKVLVKVRNWGRSVEARRTGTDGWRTCPPGGIFVLCSGEELVFRCGARTIEMSMGGGVFFSRQGKDIPAEFLSQPNLICCQIMGRHSVISPGSQKVFFPRESILRNFRFPFRSLWKDEEMRRRWDSERSYRSRLGNVLRLALIEREKGSELYREVSTDKGFESVKEAIRTRANTNVVITTGAWLLRHQLKSASIRISGRETKNQIAGIFVEEDSANGCLRSFLFDGKGRVKWAFSLVKSRPNAQAPRQLDQEKIFEFNETGELSRTVFPGAVLTVKDGEYKFSTDAQLLRSFFADWKRAVNKINDLQK